MLYLEIISGYNIRAVYTLSVLTDSGSIFTFSAKAATKCSCRSWHAMQCGSISCEHGITLELSAPHTWHTGNRICNKVPVFTVSENRESPTGQGYRLSLIVYAL
jgi:hypothetical protein